MERFIRGRLCGQVGAQPLPHWRLDLYDDTGTTIVQILELPRPAFALQATRQALTALIARALWPSTKHDPAYVRLLPYGTSQTYAFIATYRV